MCNSFAEYGDFNSYNVNVAAPRKSVKSLSVFVLATFFYRIEPRFENVRPVGEYGWSWEWCDLRCCGHQVNALAKCMLIFHPNVKSYWSLILTFFFMVDLCYLCVRLYLILPKKKKHFFPLLLGYQRRTRCYSLLSLQIHQVSWSTTCCYERE